MFVVQSPLTKDGAMVMAVNSDRPMGEVQEVVHLPSADHAEGDTVQCTYMAVSQASHTHSLVLCKPTWTWGGVMGCNEKGVTIATVAVWTKLNSAKDLEKKLLAADIVRLALERASTSREAVDVMTGLIQTYGQGGPCCEAGEDWAHHNSYVLGDGGEVWVVETAGEVWVARRLSDPVTYIKNQLTIGSDFDEKSENLEKILTDLSLYDDSSTLDFKAVLSVDQGQGCEKGQGRDVLSHLNGVISSGVEIDAKEMFEVLRQESALHQSAFSANNSLVSILHKPGSSIPTSHWLTATPNPRVSMFKPIIFTDALNIGAETKCESLQEATASDNGLYTAHKKFNHSDKLERNEEILATIRELEANCFHDICEITENFTPRNAAGVADIFQHMCKLEINFYNFD